MEKTNNYQQYALELSENLKGNHLSEVDFDRLTAWLTEVAAILAEQERLQGEVNVFRQDYIGRIAGMTKALAAADRRRDSLQTALDYIEGLGALPADELVEQYTRTQVRFRDGFSASFQPLAAREILRAGDIAQYK